MPVNLHLCDVPELVHETLVRRAERKGMSLRQYTVQALSEHCALPALDEWLDELHGLEPVQTSISAVGVCRSSAA